MKYKIILNESEVEFLEQLLSDISEKSINKIIYIEGLENASIRKHGRKQAKSILKKLPGLSGFTSWDYFFKAIPKKYKPTKCESEQFDQSKFLKQYFRILDSKSQNNTLGGWS